MKSAIRRRPESCLFPRRKAPLSPTPRPRARRPLSSRRQSRQEHDSSCRGASKRHVISAMEKLMNQLQILIEPGRRAPDFRGHLCAPNIVPGDGLAVARQIQRGTGLPVGVEHGAKAPSTALWPEVGREHRVAHYVTWTCSRRAGWKAAAIETQHVLSAFFGRNADEDVWPCDVDQAPTLVGHAGAERRTGHVRAERVFIGRHQRVSSACARGAPLTRWSGTRSNRTRQSGHEVSLPTWVPGAGRSWVPAICSMCSPASSSLILNLVTAPQCLMRATVAPGANRCCTVSPANVTATSTCRQRCR